MGQIISDVLFSTKASMEDGVHENESENNIYAKVLQHIHGTVLAEKRGKLA